MGQEKILIGWSIFESYSSSPQEETSGQKKLRLIQEYRSRKMCTLKEAWDWYNSLDDNHEFRR